MYEEQMATGFSDWTELDYQNFLSAFLRHAEFKSGSWYVHNFGLLVNDVQKPQEDCQAYFDEFLDRFTETNEVETLLQKAVADDLDWRNGNTLLNYNRYEDYALLL